MPTSLLGQVKIESIKKVCSSRSNNHKVVSAKGVVLSTKCALSQSEVQDTSTMESVACDRIRENSSSTTHTQHYIAPDGIKVE